LFEDFKEKVRERCNKTAEPEEQLELAPEVCEKLKERGIDPETATLQQLFPETLDACGSDLSLMSGAEWEIMVSYAKIRKSLLEKYPQTQEEARLVGQVWAEEPDASCQINIQKAKEDPLSKAFIKAVDQLKIIYDKIDVLQNKASDYEKFCLRYYWHVSYNWNHAPNKESFRANFQDRNADLFEVVEAYFKICRKYHVPTFEEPYYFLPEKRRQEVKLEGDMLRRSTNYSDNEIRVSILEGLE